MKLLLILYLVHVSYVVVGRRIDFVHAMCMCALNFEMHFNVFLKFHGRHPVFLLRKIPFVIISDITQFLLSFWLFLCCLLSIIRQKINKNLIICLLSTMMAEFSGWQSEVCYCLQSLSKCKPRRSSLPIINSKTGIKG